MIQSGFHDDRLVVGRPQLDWHGVPITAVVLHEPVARDWADELRRLADAPQACADLGRSAQRWARENRPDLTVVGPEAPLCAGLANALEAEGLDLDPERAGASTAQPARETQMERLLSLRQVSLFSGLSLERLQAIARIMREARVPLLIEGHCDERGSREYNIGLGERRANAVQDFLAAEGVAASQMSTISYGEERPVCRESDEHCWWQNRRVEIVYTAR